MIARIATMTALFVVAASCLAADSTAPRHVARTHDEFIAGVAKFPYSAEAARAQKIRVGVQALGHCMTSAQVVEFIGEPDFSYIAYREGTHGTVPTVKVLTYVLAQQSAQERETDQRIIVWMRLPDELRGVSVWGIKGLTGLDGSENMKCH